jgi:galacturan 1,4-alpha-galacturonidase
MFADTMDVNNIWLENFIYQGGDDCVAIKPRSYNIYIRNATCHGGNGMAIGSLGQYLEDSSVENVQISDVTIIPHDGNVGNGAYIKTWIGSLALQTAGNGAYESGGVPRGGGWGAVRNILFSNFKLNGPTHGTAITQNYGHNRSAYLPSKMQVSNVAFINFTAQRKFQGKWQPKLEGFDVALGRRFSPRTPSQSPPARHSHTSHTVTPPHRHIFLLQERACRERI